MDALALVSSTASSQTGRRLQLAAQRRELTTPDIRIHSPGGDLAAIAAFPKDGVIMLVLSRKRGQGIMIGPDVEVVVLEIRGDRVKLGFQGPANVPIHREEVYAQIVAETRAMQPAVCH
jgi:carbon storage regulator